MIFEILEEKSKLKDEYSMKNFEFVISLLKKE